MSSNLVIVAIPPEDDYVWKISSEKVPHMTLLFLGDVEGKPVLKIQEFLEHAVNILEIGPFGMDVDYRGVLGPDEADVLFFRQDWWSFKRIAEFRSQLLKNTAIRTAYESTTQFDGPWLPHLTLGYPTAPAKPLDRDYGLHYVQFDRIALWYGDYEGPEYRLEYRSDLMDPAVAYAAERGAEFLEHHGVKGMRWGIRRHTPSAAPVTVESVVRSPKLAKTRVKAKGGENHPASEDALKAAAHEQKLKRSGAHALSNKELQDLAQRMQLEQQVSQLRSRKPKTLGQKAVDDILADPIKSATTVHETVKKIQSFR